MASVPARPLTPTHTPAFAHSAQAFIVARTSGPQALRFTPLGEGFTLARAGCRQAKGSDSNGNAEFTQRLLRQPRRADQQIRDVGQE